ncbi:transglutaminase-like cysteine peptidase [Parvibaculum lavamentivorans]|nr:transglutaminase-like cysteine peptidase [Parvibaculum lavamentivorans]
MKILHIAASMCVALLLTACGTPNSTAALGLLQTDAPFASSSPPTIFVSGGHAMPTGAETPPPFGFVGFCRRYPADCSGSAVSPASMRLTDARWRDLEQINAQVNRTVRPVEDADLYNKPEWWTYPSEQGGDCEDFVLLKRRMLIERGWPADTLLISVVKERNGAGHAVLLVVTDRGEFVLDNKTRHINAWRDTPYTWVKRQSRRHPYVWVRLGSGNGGKSASLMLPEFGPGASPSLGAPIAEPLYTASGLRPSLAS